MSLQPLCPASLPDNCRSLLYDLATALPGKGRTSLLIQLNSYCTHAGDKQIEGSP